MLSNSSAVAAPQPPGRPRLISVACRDGLITVASEPERQAAVRRYGLAGRAAWSSPDPRLVNLAEHAQRVTGADACVINILDDRRQWTVSAVNGGTVTVSPRAISICQHVLSRTAEDRLVEIHDVSVDPEFADNPWVTGEVGSVRFYVAVPLITPEGDVLGTICAWSRTAGSLGDDQRMSLRIIRDAVMRHLEGNRASATHNEQGHDTSAAQPTIEQIVEQRSFTVEFQPVVHLDSGEVVAFEALTRGPLGTALERPEALLEAAAAADIVAQLDWAMRIAALRAARAARLPAEVSVLVNVEAAGLVTPPPADIAAELAAAAAGLRIVLEVVERDVGGQVLDLLHAVELARGSACAIALDDVGAVRSSLAVLPLLRPDIVKLDMSLLHGVPGRAAAVVTSAVRAYAERTGAVIVAEGVETPEQEALARVFGASFAQGFRFGRPDRLPAAVPTPRHPLPMPGLTIRRPGATPFDVLSNRHRPQVAGDELLLHVSRYLEDQSEYELDASVLMAGYHGLQQFVVVADRIEFDEASRFQTTATDPDGALRDEWLVLVARPHFAAALCARVLPDGRYEYVYTHDAYSVADAAQSFVAALVGGRKK